MSLELEERQRRKGELEKELQLLKEKEEFLSEKSKILEEKLTVHKLKRKLKVNRDGAKQFLRARTMLNRLEKSLNLREQTSMLDRDSKLDNRVQLSGNVIFSWSYQKLP